MKKILPIVGVIAGTALLITFISVWYVRPFQRVAGEGCARTSENPQGFCYEQAPSGGFPAAYLYDTLGVSVEGKLSFAEDDFYLLRFMADWLVHSAVLGTGFFFVVRLSKKLSLRDPDEISG